MYVCIYTFLFSNFSWGGGGALPPKPKHGSIPDRENK